jgi:hypothetical protein
MGVGVAESLRCWGGGERTAALVGCGGCWVLPVISVPVKVKVEGVSFLGERFAREKREDSLGEGEREEVVNCDCWEKESDF